jgi:hypothetical protein
VSTGGTSFIGQRAGVMLRAKTCQAENTNPAFVSSRFPISSFLDDDGREGSNHPKTGGIPLFTSNL